MGIVERLGVEFVTYQFQGNAKIWWWSHVECQPTEAPHMTWASFSSLFMEKYIPRTLRDRKRDEFLSLEQGRMSVTALRLSFVHYQGMPPNFVSVHKSGFVVL